MILKRKALEHLNKTSPPMARTKANRQTSPPTALTKAKKMKSVLTYARSCARQPLCVMKGVKKIFDNLVPALSP